MRTRKGLCEDARAIRLNVRTYVVTYVAHSGLSARARTRARSAIHLVRRRAFPEKWGLLLLARSLALLRMRTSLAGVLLDLLPSRPSRSRWFSYIFKPENFSLHVPPNRVTRPYVSRSPCTD